MCPPINNPNAPAQARVSGASGSVGTQTTAGRVSTRACLPGLLTSWRRITTTTTTVTTTTTTTTTTSSSSSSSASDRCPALHPIPEHTTHPAEPPLPFIGNLPCGGCVPAITKCDYPYQDGYDSDDDEDISEALLEEVGGNLGKARRRHFDTLVWRHCHGVDDILDEATPSPEAFDQILGLWPRWLQGRTRDGDLVLYEELGKVRGARLREARLKPAAWSRHLALVGEYVTRCVDQDDEATTSNGLPPNNWHDPYAAGPPAPRITMVLSFAGVTSASFFLDWAVRKTIRYYFHNLAAHYPGLIHRVLLVNVPAALSPTVLTLLRPLRLLPLLWRPKTFLVLDPEAHHVTTLPGYRAFAASGGLCPTTHVLQDLSSIIEPSQLSEAVCPGHGLDKRGAKESVEWIPLRRLVQANAPRGCPGEEEEKKEE